MLEHPYKFKLGWGKKKRVWRWCVMQYTCYLLQVKWLGLNNNEIVPRYVLDSSYWIHSLCKTDQSHSYAFCFITAWVTDRSDYFYSWARWQTFTGFQVRDFFCKDTKFQGFSRTVFRNRSCRFLRSYKSSRFSTISCHFSIFSLFSASRSKSYVVFKACHVVTERTGWKFLAFLRCSVPIRLAVKVWLLHIAPVLSPGATCKEFAMAKLKHTNCWFSSKTVMLEM